MARPISEHDLQEAEGCHLLEPDGTRWDVMDFALESGRAWIRARRPSHAGEEAYETARVAEEHGRAAEEDTERRVRIFDTVLGRGARVVWTFPGGRRVIARGDAEHGLDWEVRDLQTNGHDGGAGTGSEAGSGDTECEGFFQDDFLNS